MLYKGSLLFLEHDQVRDYNLLVVIFIKFRLF